ncbi:MAG: RNA polymerase sigma factor [Oscillospiraceae bacterium]|nr:RNA polymerase sigma factor [Oscillospiraceae bacterium]
MCFESHTAYRSNQAYIRAISIDSEVNQTYNPCEADRPSNWIEVLVQKHENKIFRTALAIMGNETDAEDIMQDVFLKIIEKKPQFESEEHEEAWLTRVTVNRCKSSLRLFWRKKSRPLHDIHPANEAVLPIYGGECGESSLLETINTLPPKYRIAIYLFYYENYSTKEIAEITNQKETTVRSQLSRARGKLKEILEAEKGHGHEF